MDYRTGFKMQIQLTKQVFVANTEAWGCCCREGVTLSHTHTHTTLFQRLTSSSHTHIHTHTHTHKQTQNTNTPPLPDI